MYRIVYGKHDKIRSLAPSLAPSMLVVSFNMIFHVLSVLFPNDEVNSLNKFFRISFSPSLFSVSANKSLPFTESTIQQIKKEFLIQTYSASWLLYGY